MYIVAVNRVGVDDYNPDLNIQGTSYCGHSMVVDPWGEIVIELGEGEGVHTVDIDLSTVNTIRREIPVLENRRPEHYGL
jgi:predicted amidohydrolase